MAAYKRIRAEVSISGWDLPGNKDLFPPATVADVVRYKDARVRFCAFVGDSVITLLSDSRYGSDYDRSPVVEIRVGPAGVENRVVTTLNVGEFNGNTEFSAPDAFTVFYGDFGEGRPPAEREAIRQQPGHYILKRYSLGNGDCLSTEAIDIPAKIP